MEKRSPEDIRTAYVEFFKSKGHQFVSSLTVTCSVMSPGTGVCSGHAVGGVRLVSFLALAQRCFGFASCSIALGSVARTC